MGKVTRHLGASRRALFESIDKPALKPLPAAPYVYAEWKQRRAGIDYHVEIDRHYYSVPHPTDQTEALGADHGPYRRDIP